MVVGVESVRHYDIFLVLTVIGFNNLWCFLVLQTTLNIMTQFNYLRIKRDLVEGYLCPRYLLKKEDQSHCKKPNMTIMQPYLY